MPRYTFKIGGSKVTAFETEERLSETFSRKLQGGTPDTRVDSGGSENSYRFESQAIDIDELREIKDIRESGGVISQLVHQKALMEFGTGAEFQTENEDLKEDLNNKFPNLDNLLIEIGEDATWFPFGLTETVETKGGDFSHVELVEPWTMVPQTNEFGEIIAWEQHLQNSREPVDVYQPDELASFVLNKASGRDKTGISEVKRAEDEIRAYRENKQAIDQAVDTAAYRRHWWQVGREGAGVIDDNELRRVRNRLSNLEGDTQLFTGQDIDHELMDAMDPSAFKTISEMDMRNLALALGVPIELASVISEGLGSGEQSGVRMEAFLLQAKAAQRSLTNQFAEQVARPIIEEYSPYNPDELDGITLGEPLSDEPPLNELEPYMKTNEIRRRHDLPPEEDEEIGESYRKPENIQAPDGEEAESDGLGIFGEGEEGNANRALSDAPDFDEPYLRIFEERLWTDENDSKSLVAFNESEVPEMVMERIREAIMSGSVFSDIESIPSSELMDLRTTLAENLGQDGWSLRDLSEELEERFELDASKADTIARSETASAVNTAREDAYTERGEANHRFYWTGPNQPDRTTEACAWLKDQTNPKHGGEPVSLEELKELIQEAPKHDPDLADNMAREWIVHPNERHTWVRHVE